MGRQLIPMRECESFFHSIFPFSSPSIITLSFLPSAPTAKSALTCTFYLIHLCPLSRWQPVFIYMWGPEVCLLCDILHHVQHYLTPELDLYQ